MLVWSDSCFRSTSYMNLTTPKSFYIIRFISISSTLDFVLDVFEPCQRFWSQIALIISPPLVVLLHCVMPHVTTCDRIETHDFSSLNAFAISASIG